MGDQRYDDVGDDEILSCIARVRQDVDGKDIELNKCL